MLTKSKKAASILSICVVLLFITACAEPPHEVREEMAKIETAKEERKRIEKRIVYVSPSELKKSREAKTSVDYGVLRFQGEVVIPDIEKVCLLEMKVNDEAFNNIEKTMPLLMQFAGMRETDWKPYIVDWEPGSQNAEVEGRDASIYAEKGFCFVEKDTANFSVNQSGLISINQKRGEEGHPHFLSVDGTIEGTWSFVNDKEVMLTKEVEWNGEKVILRELADDFETGVNLFNECTSELGLMLHDARMMTDRETGEEMLVFRALSSYKGVFFDSNYIIPQTGEKSFVGFEMNQQIHDKGDQCKIALRETSYLVSGELKEYTEVIDFDSALNLLRETAPQDKVTIIESAEFMYQIFYEGEEGQNWQYAYEKPPVFYAAPVWKFVEKERASEMKATVYYVDAVSGSVYSFYQACTP